MNLEYISIALSAVSLIFMLAITVFLILNNKKVSTLDKTELEDKISEQSEDITQVIKQYIKEESGYTQDSLSRQMIASNSAILDGQRLSQDGLSKSMDTLISNEKQAFYSLETKIGEQISDMRKEVAASIKEIREDNTSQNKDIRELLESKITALQKEVGDNLKGLRQENEEKLNQMRQTVDEKLQETLNNRISESFKVINTQLEAVHKGLGEMAVLSNGVNNLNKVLSNVKTRGVWGEVSLENMLEQILTPEQYGKQVALQDNREAVDFAIFLPGKEKDKIILPIDAKFPLSDYEKLSEAGDRCDVEGVQNAKKALFARIKHEAKSIGTKYILIPKTTNFAIMYLPIEGLFAEVVREAGLVDELQNKYKVIVSGPTTLSALLNSLQMGFRTLAIQERSADVWKALSNFKNEFNKFASVLTKVQKKANEVVDTIDDSVKKTIKIEKVLNKLGDMDFDTEIKLIPESGGVNDEM